MIASLLQPDNRWINAQRIEASGGMFLSPKGRRLVGFGRR